MLIETDYKFSVIIDCSTISGLDYTAIKGIEVLAKDLCEKDQAIVLQNLDFKLQKLIGTGHSNLSFCENDEKLKEVLAHSESKRNEIHYQNYRNVIF